MIIVGTPEDYRFLAGKCDGRCTAGEWCIFADENDHTECPIDNDENFIVVKKSKNSLLEVE